MRPAPRRTQDTGGPGGLGWGIEELLADPLVENISIDGHDRVFVHRCDGTKTRPKLPAADCLVDVAGDQR